MSLIGGPLHCGNPMTPVAGYQCGPPDAYLTFRCDYCHKVESHYGEVKGAVGHETWHPRKMAKLIVLMRKAENGVICKGICNDITHFENILYVNADAALKGIGERYGKKNGYTVHFNLPEPEKENA